jgi:hypothetical protein
VSANVDTFPNPRLVPLRSASPEGDSSLVDAVDQVRQVVADAAAAGEPTPGRPTLVRRTGLTDHQVRKALATLTAEKARPARVEESKGGSPTGSPVAAEASGSPVLAGAGAAGGRPSPAADAHQGADRDGPGAGRLVAWLGFVFGSVMSVAANVLYTWLPADGMPEGWSPGIAPQVGAAAWPLGLVLSVEILSRVKWGTGWGWTLARYGGAGTVALGSAVISYGHLSGVLLAWGYGSLEAHVGPLVLDGLMTISGFALLAMSKHQHANADGAGGDLS